MGNRIIFLVCLILGMALSRQLVAQDSTAFKSRPNIFKINLSSRALYSDSYIFSYERVLKPHETLSVSAGYVTFPVFTALGTIKASSTSQSGFMAGADYRFYLKKENKYAAPHGVFIGPYASYYGFSNDRIITSDLTGVTTQGNLHSDISFTSVGFQIGYQFVLNNRWAFDFIFMGPSVTNYNLNLKLNGNFNLDEQSEIVQDIISKFPLLNQILDAKEVNINGRTNTWKAGYRYTIHVGYKFGRKK